MLAALIGKSTLNIVSILCQVGACKEETEETELLL
jgi:hypothetical protein